MPIIGKKKTGVYPAPTSTEYVDELKMEVSQLRDVLTDRNARIIELREEKQNWEASVREKALGLAHEYSVHALESPGDTLRRASDYERYLLRGIDSVAVPAQTPETAEGEKEPSAPTLDELSLRRYAATWAAKNATQYTTRFNAAMDLLLSADDKWKAVEAMFLSKTPGSLKTVYNSLVTGQA